MIQLIRDNALLIISAIGTVNLIQAGAMIVKSFSQKKLNKTFDKFNAGASALYSNANDISGQLQEFKKSYNELQTAIILLSVEITEFTEKAITNELTSALGQVDLIRQTLNSNSELIDAYAKDMHAIRIALNTIDGRGGYNDILQVKQETQEVVQVESNIDNAIVNNSTDRILEDI